LRWHQHGWLVAWPPPSDLRWMSQQR
jgi:hypothetical protein